MKRVAVKDTAGLLRAMHGFNGNSRLKACDSRESSWPRSTIGYGTIVANVVVTPEIAESILNAEIATMRDDLADQAWFTALNEPRQAVVIDLMRTMGYGRMLYSGMVMCLQEHDHEGAAQWISDHLVGRRAQVYARIMRTGKWPARVRIQEPK